MGHGTHADALAAPSTALYVDWGHSEHCGDPEPAANEPAGHGAQTAAPDDEDAPGGHARHVLADDAPEALDACPAAHGRQEPCDCPGAGLYVPGGHARHVDADVAPGALL